MEIVWDVIGWIVAAFVVIIVGGVIVGALMGKENKKFAIEFIAAGVLIFIVVQMVKAC